MGDLLTREWEDCAFRTFFVTPVQVSWSELECNTLTNDIIVGGMSKETSCIKATRDLIQTGTGRYAKTEPNGNTAALTSLPRRGCQQSVKTEHSPNLRCVVGKRYIANPFDIGYEEYWLIRLCIRSFLVSGA